MLKRFFCALVAVVLCLTIPITANAETAFNGVVNEEIAPRYSVVFSPSILLNISGSSADCFCDGSGDSNEIQSISVVMTLEKSGFLGIYSAVSGAKWTKTANGRSITLTGSKSGLADGTYRVKAVFTITKKSGGTETITEYSDTETVG